MLSILAYSVCLLSVGACFGILVTGLLNMAREEDALMRRISAQEHKWEDHNLRHLH